MGMLNMKILEDYYKLMEAANEVIDGDMNCHTPEYRSIDLLRRSIIVLGDAIQILWKKERERQEQVKIEIVEPTEAERRNIGA